MNFYIRYTKKTFPFKVTDDLLNKIKVKTSQFGDYHLFTYTPATPKGTSDDLLYSENPILVEILPRSFSIIVRDSRIIGVLSGNRKFTGPTLSDDDVPETTRNKLMESNYKKIKTWEKQGNLEIVQTTKENGKLAIMTIIHDQERNKTLIVGGSKNYHIILEDTDILSSSVHGELIRDIFACISTDIDKIKRVVPENCSIVGELCDSKHFCKGNGKISWFGFVKDGLSIDSMITLKTLRDASIPCVPWELITVDFDYALNISKTLESEGSVLYCRNTLNNETILVKCKSTLYIVKRFLRQVLLNSGTQGIKRVQNRFIDAAAYHGLNTTAAIVITKLFNEFACFYAKKGYPTSFLGVVTRQAPLVVASGNGVSTSTGNIKNDILVGFYHYWNEFLTETGTRQALRLSSRMETEFPRVLVK
jgi:hypothetical protein